MINIIIKRTPTWRPLQPNISKFKSLHKKPEQFDPTKSVEEQFSKEELAKIQGAALFTKSILKEDEIVKNGQDYNIL